VDDSKPVSVITTFRLQPGCREPWLELWRELREAAQAMPACRQFHLLFNRHDEAECVVLSEWDRESEFDNFARDLGLIWIDRGMDRVCEQPQYAVFEEAPNETHQAVQLRNPELASVQP
jgi:hypothetical protein